MAIELNIDETGKLIADLVATDKPDEADEVLKKALDWLAQEIAFAMVRATPETDVEAQRKIVAWMESDET